MLDKWQWPCDYVWIIQSGCLLQGSKLPLGVSWRLCFLMFRLSQELQPERGNWVFLFRTAKTLNTVSLSL